ncbi:MAG: phage portal protein [Alphaproteobacteria bacterium RIFCSPHIGHO2_01_FULL_41_14]|nr:MAG: phage portal protein [Alphaproteobacteria bacterium GWB1_45_5]OFW76560.1 MAG: phage portal protein [Alphaproteobacteria bacterium GWA1_45_9]OFW89644.1 MAG: phage portal protein [Alphaproteobacteria bacterium RIFCSPHIGHO2_01_FULL_41_14]HCI49083.1 phage portal protein [Holosporales bacterium]
MLNWKTLMGWRKEKPSAKDLAWVQGGRPMGASRTYTRLAEEGYERNVIVYRCINLIAKNLAMPPWILYEGDREVERHVLADLIENPNPLQTRTTFLESLASYLLLDGNVYVQAVGEEGVPRELFLLRPDRVQIMAGDGTLPRGYVYQVEGKKSYYPVDPETGACAILHLKLFHPSNDWYGLSPIQAAAAAIDQHNAVGSHNLSLLRNGGRPSGALVMPGNEGLTDEQRMQLKETVRNLYQGSENSGQILVLEGGMKWCEMGLTPKDLDFMAGKHISTREIAQAFGVPSMLVGVPGDSTFSNYREARFHLWEDTVLPLLHMVMEEMNRWIVPAYGEQLAFAYDADQIPALGCRRERLWNRIQDATFLTVNEKRSALGYSPLLDGNNLENIERKHNDSTR